MYLVTGTAGCFGAADYGKKGESYILANEEVTFRDFVKLICDESGCKPINIYLTIKKHFSNNPSVLSHHQQ